MFKPLQPRSIEIGYYGAIKTTVDAWSEAAIRYAGMLPSGNDRTDGYFDDLINAYFAALTRDWDIAAQNVKFANWFGQVALFNWREWGKQVKAGTKYELPATQPFSEPGISRLANEWILKNNDLIKGFKQQRDRQLRDAIFRGVTQGKSREQLIKDILPSVTRLNETMAGQTNLSAYQRADLIATDQILTANAQLGAQRMANAGVSYYIWRGMDDARERPAHVALNDLYFRLDGQPMTAADYKALGISGQKVATPGSEVAPGIPVRCRCFPEAVFEGSAYDPQAAQGNQLPGFYSAGNPAGRVLP